MAKGRVLKMYDDTVEAIKGMVGAKTKKKAKKDRNAVAKSKAKKNKKRK
jgi:hypothetical protein